MKKMKNNIISNLFWQQTKGKIAKRAMLNDHYGLDKLKLPRYLKNAVKKEQYDLIAEIFSEQYSRLLMKIKLDFDDQIKKIIDLSFTYKIFFMGNRGNEILETLMEIDPDFKNFDLFSYLHYAIAFDNVKAFKKIILKKPDTVFTFDLATGSTLLHYAINEGAENIVNALLESETDQAKQMCLKTDSVKNTVLHSAASLGNVVIIKKLLEILAEQAPDVCQQLNDNQTHALYLAAEHGNPEVVKLLLNTLGNNGLQKIDMHEVLCFASKSGNVETIDLILKILGKDAKEACQKKGAEKILTPIMYAAFKGNPAAVRRLLQEIGENTYSAEVTSILLTQGFRKGDQKIVNELLKTVDNPQAYMKTLCENAANQTLLHSATSGDASCFKQLLELLGDQALTECQRATTEEGNTPLHIAAREGNQAIVELIVKQLGNTAKVEFERTNRLQQTTLHLATESGNVDLVKWLLKTFGSEIFKKACQQLDKNLNPPLYSAALSGNPNLFKFFINFYLDNNLDLKMGNFSDCTMLVVNTYNLELITLWEKFIVADNPPVLSSHIR